MKAKEELIQEIEESPDFIAEEVLNFLLFLKIRIKDGSAEDKKETSPEHSNLDFVPQIGREISLRESEIATNPTLLETTSKEETDEDFEDHRGVLVVKHEPKVIFSKQITIETSKLPRWKPHITIDRRMIEAEEDE